MDIKGYQIIKNEKIKRDRKIRMILISFPLNPLNDHKMLLSISLKGFLEDSQTIKAMNEIEIAPIIT